MQSAAGGAESPLELIRRVLVLPTIVFSSFAGTSIWFAPNAVVSSVPFRGGNPGSEDADVALLTSMVQVGFVVGTIAIAFFAVADRFPATLVFAAASVLGAICNGACAATSSLEAWAALRFLVGCCEAGIYPLAMTVAHRIYPQGLGARLGLLVGALTLGTAFPWLLKAALDPGGGTGTGEAGGPAVSYVLVLLLVSALAALGGLAMPLVIGSGRAQPSGDKVAPAAPLKRGGAADADREPSHKQASLTPGLTQAGAASEAAADRSGAPAGPARPGLQLGRAEVGEIWASRPFRAAALGYIGHCWEVYSFWAFVPALIRGYTAHIEAGGVAGASPSFSVEALSFVAIAVGAPGSALVGLFSLYPSCRYTTRHPGRKRHCRAGADTGAAETGLRTLDVSGAADSERRTLGREEEVVIPGSAVGAIVSIATSFVCCLIAPAYRRMSEPVFILFLVVWGGTVVSDSGQFSSLSAGNAPRRLVGTALTMVVTLGYTTTIVSLQVVGALLNAQIDPGMALLVLAPGAAIGLAATYAEWPLHRSYCQPRTRGV